MRKYILPMLLIAQGCTQTSLDECIASASKSPTEQGVRLAAAACYQKYQEKQSQADEILSKSVKCDQEKLVQFANYIVINKEQKAQRDFEIVAAEYKKIRAACEAIGK